MIKTLRWLTYLITISAAFFGGVYFNQLLKIPSQPTNFADTISAIAALAGIIIATITITNWKRSKIQEDSYQLMKNYVAELVLIETTVTEILIESSSISPLPGNPVPSQTFLTTALQNIASLEKALNKLHFKISQTKGELSFWGTKLTPAHEENHNTLQIDLDNFQTVSHCLTNNLKNYYTNGLSTLDQVSKEHEKLISRFHKIKTTLTSRKARKMSDMFTIES